MRLAPRSRRRLIADPASSHGLGVSGRCGRATMWRAAASSRRAEALNGLCTAPRIMRGNMEGRTRYARYCAINSIDPPVS